jgi:hypothetical protein
MQIKLPAKIPAQSVYYLLMCSVGILLFILIGLFPLQSSLNEQDEDMAKMKARIEEQKVLFPLYKELLLLEKTQKRGLNALPASGKTGLSMDQLGNVSYLLKKIAQEGSLEAVSVNPDVKSLTNNSKSISVLLVVRGDFLKLRRFLFELEKLPYLEHIEEIQIQEAAEGKEFRLKTWLAVSCGKST